MPIILIDRQQYTNAKAEQVCQVCKDVLPFKLNDGSFYFEILQLLPEFEQQRYSYSLVFHFRSCVLTYYASRSAQKETALGTALCQGHPPT